MVRIFESGDKPFIEWREANPDGFVLNTGRGVGSNFLRLHRADCLTIGGVASSENGFTSRNYIKITATRIQSLRRWIRDNRGRVADECPKCRPGSRTKHDKLRMGVNGPSRTAVERAIRGYCAGKRPWPEWHEINWHIATDSGRLVPVKYIYAMACGEMRSGFTTDQARRQLKLLGFKTVSVLDARSGVLEFEQAVARALKDPAARRKRLKAAARRPTATLATVVVFNRNADVVAEVLERSKGRCEGCGKPAPFQRLADATPYLEVHHWLPLAKGGDDVVENAVALCPNCHRQAHYGAGLSQPRVLVSLQTKVGSHTDSGVRAR
jgi:5-methylcytosine-specific restriction enzyme A